MTVREKIENMLVQNGMFESQAKEVMDLAIDDLNKDNYKITFDRPSNEYPDPFYIVIFLRIKPIALKWINENKPLAWYKPMFE